MLGVEVSFTSKIEDICRQGLGSGGVKNPPADRKDIGPILVGKILGEGIQNLLQYLCLKPAQRVRMGCTHGAQGMGGSDMTEHAYNVQQRQVGPKKMTFPTGSHFWLSDFLHWLS